MQCDIKLCMNILSFFLEIIEFQKTHLLFKLIFRAAQLQQRHKYDVFQKHYFAF